MVKPAARRVQVAWVRKRYSMSVRRACQVLEMAESTYRYRSCRREPEGLRARLLELLLSARDSATAGSICCWSERAEESITSGSSACIARNALQCVASASLRLIVGRECCPRVQTNAGRWTSRRTAWRPVVAFRTLNVVDDFSRECLAIEVDTSLSGERVTRVLDRVIERRGTNPTSLVMDNGPEFAGRALDAWAYRRGIRLDFIRPGKPIENCFVESFNGKVRDECLNQHWFIDLADARLKIETWRLDYNQVRPHSSLGGVPPAGYAERAGLQPTAPQSTSAPPVSPSHPGGSANC